MLLAGNRLDIAEGHSAIPLEAAFCSCRSDIPQQSYQADKSHKRNVVPGEFASWR